MDHHKHLVRNMKCRLWKYIFNSDKENEGLRRSRELIQDVCV